MLVSALGPVLIGGLTTLIGNFFVNRQQQIAAEREFRASELKKANEVFDEVSIRMAALAELSKNSMWALVLRPNRVREEGGAPAANPAPKKKRASAASKKAAAKAAEVAETGEGEEEGWWTPEDIKSWASYNEEREQWNRSRARNLALTKKYFGAPAAKSLKGIQDDLEQLETYLDATYYHRTRSRYFLTNKNQQKKTFLEISDRLLGNDIVALTETMIDKIQKQEVGALTGANI